MRKLTVLLIGLVVGVVAGVTGWQVGFAAPVIDSVTVCTRVGADVRSPAANGTCPSGYTKTEISDGAPGQDGVSPTITATTNKGVDESWTATSVDKTITTISVPAGTYVVTADVRLDAGGTGADASMACRITPPTSSDNVFVHHLAGPNSFEEDASKTQVVSLPAAGSIALVCGITTATHITDVLVGGYLTAIPVTGVDDQAP